MLWTYVLCTRSARGSAVGILDQPLLGNLQWHEKLCFLCLSRRKQFTGTQFCAGERASEGLVSRYVGNHRRHMSKEVGAFFRGKPKKQRFRGRKRSIPVFSCKKGVLGAIANWTGFDDRMNYASVK